SLSPCCFPDTGTPASCPLSLPDALPICRGGTEHPAADVRYPRQFQQPLYRAVLTVFAVEYGKDHIDGDLVGRLALRQHQDAAHRSEEHTSELQSRENLVCRLLLEKKKLM